MYDKFHVLQHANKAIDEVRRAEFFRKGGRMRGVVKGKRWLLLTRWMNLDSKNRQQLNGSAQEFVKACNWRGFQNPGGFGV